MIRQKRDKSIELSALVNLNYLGLKSNVDVRQYVPKQYSIVNASYSSEAIEFMEDFTPEQINGIANSYNNMARALNKFQALYWSELTHEQQLDLNAYQNSLLNRVQDIQSRTVRPAFKSASEMATIIQQATDEANVGIQRMTDPTVALNIGAITVALAAYVARANLRGIQTALRELGELLKLKVD